MLVNLCFLHRKSSLMASPDLRPLSSRKSHWSMTELICVSSTHTHTHHSSLLHLHRGGNPFATIRLRPTVTNDRSAPVIWSGHISTRTRFPHLPVSSTPSLQLLRPLSTLSLLLVWRNKTTAGRRKRTPFESGLPLLLRTLKWKYFWTFHRRDAHIFKMYILYLFVVVIF